MNTFKLSPIALALLLSVTSTATLAYMHPGEFPAHPNEPAASTTPVTVGGAPMYATERARISARDFPGGFDAVAAGETFGEFLAGATTDNVLELRRAERNRIFNLGYFTWVEQQGVPIEEFEARRRPEFWTQTRSIVERWDRQIEALNERTGALEAMAGRGRAPS